MGLNPGAPIDIGDAAANAAAADDGGGGKDEDDAMLAAAIAASLASSTPGGNAVPATPQYVTEKETLRGMGFADDAANQVALEAANGDVQRALEMLLG